jgi:hypothetical protein
MGKEKEGEFSQRDKPSFSGAWCFSGARPLDGGARPLDELSPSGAPKTGHFAIVKPSRSGFARRISLLETVIDDTNFRNCRVTRASGHTSPLGARKSERKRRLIR